MSKRTITAEIRAENRQLNQKLGESEKKVGGFSSMVKKAGIALVAAFAAKKVIGGLKDLTIGLANTADRLMDLQDITGISTDALQEYEYVAKVAGVNTETLGRAAEGLTRRMGRATSETSPLNVAMRQLGIETRTSSGELRDAGMIMDESITALAEMENQTERNVLGSQLFGGAWSDMAPILSMGAEGINEVRQQARDMGIVMDREALEKANELRVGLVELDGQMQALRQEIGLKLIPILTDHLVPAIQSAVGYIGRFSEGFSRLIGTYDAFSDSQKNATGQLDEFLQGLSHLDDDELKREKLIDYMYDLENQQRGLGDAIKDLRSKRFIPLTKAHRQASATLEGLNVAYDQNAKIINTVRHEMEDLIAKTNEAGEANEKLNEGVEEGLDERVAAIGSIAEKEEQLAEAKDGFLNAINDEERAMHKRKMMELREEIALLKEVAEARATASRGDTGPDLDTPEKADSRDAEVTRDHTEALRENVGMLEKRNEVTDAHKEQMAETRESLQQWESMATQAAASVGMGMMQMAQDSSRSASDVIKSLLGQVTAQLIAKIIASVPFPANIALAAGAGGMAGMLFNQIPQFADGGKVTSPTLAMFGEYPGARTNPEYALREDQLRNITGGGGGNLTARVSGQDLLFTLNEAERRNKSSF